MKVVLLHAFPLDERMWEGQLKALAGREVVAPNLYELGGNSIEAWAGQILAETPGDLAAVGASLGGYVGLAMARQASDRVRALLLAGSRASADPPERRTAREEMIRVVAEEGIEGWNRDFYPPGPSDRTTDELLRGIEALRDRADATDVVAAFQGALTVVVGDQDELLPAQEARRIAASAPNGRLELVGGAGHLVNLDAPERFDETLGELLERAKQL
jgi:pimeloyl-ACP methyl ester carboxylesterase